MGLGLGPGLGLGLRLGSNLCGIVEEIADEATKECDQADEERAFDALTLAVTDLSEAGVLNGEAPAVVRDALVDAEREVAPEDGVGQQPRRHVEGLESGPGSGLG